MTVGLAIPGITPIPPGNGLPAKWVEKVIVPAGIPRRMTAHGHETRELTPRHLVHPHRKRLPYHHLVLRPFVVKSPLFDDGDPIMKLPAGATTISGHPSQSRNTCPAVHFRCCSTAWAAPTNPNHMANTAAVHEALRITTPPVPCLHRAALTLSRRDRNPGVGPPAGPSGSGRPLSREPRRHARAPVVGDDVGRPGRGIVHAISLRWVFHGFRTGGLQQSCPPEPLRLRRTWIYRKRYLPEASLLVFRFRAVGGRNDLVHGDDAAPYGHGHLLVGIEVHVPEQDGDPFLHLVGLG